MQRVPRVPNALVLAAFLNAAAIANGVAYTVQDYDLGRQIWGQPRRPQYVENYVRSQRRTHPLKPVIDRGRPGWDGDSCSDP